MTGRQVTVLRGPGFAAQLEALRSNSDPDGRGFAALLRASLSVEAGTEFRPEVDDTAWDADRAYAGAASADDPAAFYAGICAATLAGDPSSPDSHALAHHYHPSDPPNAAGVREALARVSLMQDLTNRDAARDHLEAHMKVIDPDYEPAAVNLPKLVPTSDGGYVVNLTAQGAQARREAFGGQVRSSTDQIARIEPFRATWRHAPEMVNGKEMQRLDGYASVVGMEYEMWDMFGPYGETIAPGAFDKTIAANPDVTFLVNHKGLSMARTRSAPGASPTLELDADPRGLHSLAFVNPQRTDVRDLLIAIDDHNVTEMSFAFMINDGYWSDDFEHFTISEVDIDRGDVSAVNYGANPYTSIAARTREIVSSLDRLPEGAQRAAFSKLAKVLGGDDALETLTRAAQAKVEMAPTGRSVAYYKTILDLG